MTNITIPVEAPSEGSANIHIGESLYRSGTVQFDTITRYKYVDKNVTCLNVGKDEAEQIIAALRAVYPARKPFLGYGGTGDRSTRSDSENAVYGYPKRPELHYSGRPEVMTIDVDGVTYILCNWHDYRGWEVRRKAEGLSEPIVTLGWVVQDFPGYITAKCVGASERFTTLTNAIYWLRNRQ